jgi:hypothetical protein
MRIDIRTNDVVMNRKKRARIEGYVESALARYAARIGRVMVYIRDTNGPRSGLDHRCRISIHLPAGDRVVVAKSGVEIMPLVKQTADRAAFAVRRRFNRRRTVRRRGAALV